MDSFVADYEVEAKDRRKIPPGTGCSLRDWNDLCLGCRRPVQRKIAKGEVARHNKKGDMWMVLQGKVYDVTLFGKHHPAGEAILLPCAGKDATLMYNKFHAYVQIDPLLGAFCLGVLDPHATYEPPPPYQFRKSSESTAEKNGPTQDIPVPGARGEADPRAKGGSRFSAPLITASLPEKKGAEKAATGSFPPSLGLAPRKVSSFARAVNEPPAKPPLPWKPGEPLTQDIVSSSCSKDRLWTIIHGKVYDLTAFAKSHPGGPSILFKNGGKECGAEFDKIHSFSAKAQLADLYLGDLKTSPSALLTSSAWAPPPGGRAKGRPPPGSAAYPPPPAAASGGRDPAGVALSLVAKRDISPNSAVFRFKTDDVRRFAKFPVAGHVRLSLQDGGGGASRPYTPVNVDADPKAGRVELEFVIKKYAAGTLSEPLHALAVGSRLFSTLPLEPRRPVPLNSPCYVLAAAGTGIAPILALLEALMAAPGGRPTQIRLVCCNRTEADVLLRERVEQVVARDPAYVVKHYLSDEPKARVGSGQVGKGGGVVRERFSQTACDDFFAPLASSPSSTTAVVCGTPSFNTAVSAWLQLLDLRPIVLE
ncbi:Nitrate reductase [Diplonema papillatum]|nr:Nitrate reductase [Diplonema papillatum]